MAMTAAQYSEQLRALLPPGDAFAAQDGSTVANLLYALAIELSRVDENGDTLLDQLFPDATTDFLADWERITGLPDECAQGAQTDAERRTAVIQKLAANSSPTIGFLIGVASDLGYNITIVEREARRVESSCGGYLGGTPWNFVWQIETPLEQAQTRRVGTPCGGQLSHWIDPVMPCRIGHHRPAHTILQLPWPSPDIYVPEFPESPYLWGINLPLSFDLTTTGGVGPFTYAVDYLPAGLQLNNGTISGTPTALGTSLSHVTVTDANGRTAVSTLQWNVVTNPIVTLFQQLGAQGSYYDPSDLSTLFQDSAMTAPVTAAGQPTGAVKDKSGNGNDATQATTSSCPTYEVDGNGLPYLQTDGVDDYLKLPDSALPFTPLYTAMILGSWVSGRLISRSLTSNLSGMWGYDYNYWNAYAAARTKEYIATTNTSFSVQGLSISPTEIAAYRNSVNQGSVAADFSVDSVPAGNRALFAELANASLFSAAECQCYGFVCIGAALTATQRSLVDTALAAKAGIAI